ncbi:MAG TPA: branched-chain amino acid ABC transporter permease [Chloroflexota bacterium]
MRSGPGETLGAAIVGLLVIGAVIIPARVGGFLPHQLTSYLIFGLFALSVSLITGYGRLFNIGIGATFGVGGYAVAMLTAHGVTNPWLILLCSLGAGTAVSLLFSVYAMVATGIEYLMLTFLTTLAFFNIPLAIPDVAGGENGLQVKAGLEVSFGLNPLRGNGFYWFTLAISIAVAALSWYLLSSQAGQATRAIGRNPSRAAAMGYNVSAYRIALTLYSGLVASLAGWLYALQSGFVFQDLLGPTNSLNGLVYALIGGVDSIVGPFMGSHLLRWLSERLSQQSTQSSLYVGFVLLLVVFFIPDGLVGRWRQLWQRRTAPAAAVPAEELEEIPAVNLAGPENETAL